MEDSTNKKLKTSHEDKANRTAKTLILKGKHLLNFNFFKKMENLRKFNLEII